MPPIDPLTRPVQDGIVSRDRDPRGHEFVVWEPGNGTRYTFLFLATRHLPGNVQRELNAPQGAIVAMWLNPVNHPTRMAATWFSDSSAHLAPSWVARKLGVSINDAMIVARLFAFIAGVREKPAPSIEAP